MFMCEMTMGEKSILSGSNMLKSSTSFWFRGERYQHFGARIYDSVACAWTGVDPLAEKYSN